MGKKYTEAQKRATSKWAEKNPDIIKYHSRIYAMKKYNWNKIRQEFFNILLII